MKDKYFCIICGKWFRGEPHTDPATGEDCHEKCCPVCHPMRGQRPTTGAVDLLDSSAKLALVVQPANH